MSAKMHSMDCQNNEGGQLRNLFLIICIATVIRPAVAVIGTGKSFATTNYSDIDSTLINWDTSIMTDSDAFTPIVTTAPWINTNSSLNATLLDNMSIHLMNSTCKQYSEYINNLWSKVNLSQHRDMEGLSTQRWAYVYVQYALYNIGLPVVCCIGIFGNILNLMILTRKQLKTTMNWMEKSAHLGLVALAVSDMLFCTVALPIPFKPEKMTYTEDDSMFMLYYAAYYQPVVNTFMLSSTWLTVIMATGRYFAICHPLHARGFVDLTTTRVAILAIFILSFLFNLVSFWRYFIIKQNCTLQCTCYIPVTRTIFKDHTFKLAYSLAWSVLGVFVPLVILLFCNICLIRALRHSRKIRRLYRAGHTADDSGHRLTPTLVTIIILFMVLVSPSEILRFAELFHVKDHSTYYTYQIMMITTNFMQTINFAINFILYCTLNIHFRKTMRRFLCCNQTSKPPPGGFLKNYQCHTTVTFNMSDVDTNT